MCWSLYKLLILISANRERGSQLITYNKNAKYEQELLREEERRLVLKARRNARKSVRSDSSLQSEAGCHGDGFKYMDEDSWQQGAAESSGNHGNSGMTCGSAGIQDDIQYEVDSQAAGQQRMHTGVKLKRIVRTAMVEDQIEAGIFAGKTSIARGFILILKYQFCSAILYERYGMSFSAEK